MKKLITLFCLFTVLCNAQTNVTYKTLNYDLQMRSLNGDSVSLFKKLAEGKTVIIDISATWCPPCWDFHKKKNDEAWLELLTSLNLQETNQGTLLDKLQEYNFPTKIK